MRLRLLAVGRDRKKLFGAAPERYRSRIERYLPFELIEIPASRRPEPDRARGEEAERLLSLHGCDRRLVALEVTGDRLSSEEFARLLGRLMLEGRDVDMVVGGDEGLDASVRAAAEFSVSLGPMTLPHLLARLVLLEQTYRALTILRNEPYHK